MNRKILLALILITAVSTLSIIAVKPVFAQTYTPYVPEFSVTCIASSSTVNQTNQYTGATVTYTYINDTVQIVILNQAYPQSVNGTTAGSLYYNVQEEGHFGNGNDWSTISSYAPASNSEYTTLDFGYGLGSSLPNQIQGNIPSGGQLDFQVQALLGSITAVQEPSGGPFTMYYGTVFSTVFNGQKSAWSNPQTITLSNGSTSTSISSSPYPTYSPTPIPTSTSTPTSPASTPNSQPNSTVTPQNPTTKIQTKTGAGFNWTQIALFTAIAVIAALIIVVVVLVRQRKVAQKT